MSDPGQELAALAAALRSHQSRRARSGVRRIERTPPGQAPPQAPAPDAQPAPAAAAPETRSSSSTDPVPARSETVPRPAPVAGEATPAAHLAPFPATWGETPDRKPEVAARAEEIRTRAAAAPDLESLRGALAACNACSLGRTRTQTVFMDGTGPARVMFVGEAPGFHEDRRGTPFVGPAGQLLTDIVTKGMGLDRSEVVIANVLKCRPPENRDPTGTEKLLCTGWLDRQIELVDPAVLIALGRHAAGHLLSTNAPMARLRGRVWERDGRKVVATYHPAYLLRSPDKKKDCWIDIQLAMRELGLEPPAKDGNPSRAR